MYCLRAFIFKKSLCPREDKIMSVEEKLNQAKGAIKEGSEK